MRSFSFKRLFIVAGLLTAGMLNGQTVTFTHVADKFYSNVYSGYTPVFDKLGRPYLYVASKELGLTIYDINTPSNPVLLQTIPVASFNNLKPNSLTQDGNYLYVATGDFQTLSVQRAGLTIIDVSNPLVPVIDDHWDSAAYAQGGAIVQVEGNYAYLGAMEEGVITLDVSNKQNILFKSRIIPDPVFGNPPYSPNARGMYIKNDTMLLGYDAGGLRMIDFTNKLSPQEIGKYINTSLTSVATAAYNNVVRVGHYAYVPIDYCGLEVIDISNPANMQSAYWLNPWGCNNSDTAHDWQGGHGHMNEIVFVQNDSIVIISAGDSEVLAVDATDPNQPAIIGSYGPPGDAQFSWGVDARNGLVAVTLVHNLIQLPVVSTTGGFRLLNWNYLATANEQNSIAASMKLFPNPAGEESRLLFFLPQEGEVSLGIYDISGRCVKTLVEGSLPAGLQRIHIDASDLPGGAYTCMLHAGGVVTAAKLLIVK